MHPDPFRSDLLPSWPSLAWSQLLRLGRLLPEARTAWEGSFLFEVAGGERTLKIGFDAVSLTFEGRRRAFTLSVGYDGLVTGEVQVDTRSISGWKLSGLVRASGRLGSDPALAALAGLVREAARRLDPAPAGELPVLLPAVMPRLRSFARGVKITPGPAVGELWDTSGNLTRLWWDERTPAGWRTRKEVRVTLKVGVTRSERTVRVGYRVKIPGGELPDGLRLLSRVLG